jgi:hypothetical protein
MFDAIQPYHRQRSIPACLRRPTGGRRGSRVLSQTLQPGHPPPSLSKSGEKEPTGRICTGVLSESGGPVRHCISAVRLSPPRPSIIAATSSRSRDRSIRTSTTSTPVRFTPAKQTATPCSLAPVSPHKHGSFQRWLHLEGGRSRAWVLLPQASQIFARCGCWCRFCKCTRLVYPSHPDPFIHTSRPGLRHSRHPQEIHTATPLLHAGATLRARPCASSKAPGMPDVVSTYHSYAPRSAAV